MNRLWVRVSIIIAFVVIIVGLSPVAFRALDPPDPPGDDRVRRPEGVTDEQIDKFERDIENKVWINISQTLSVGAILALAAGVVASRWLVSPLSSLEEGAEAVAEHKLNYRVPVRGSKELQSVATAFNQMADTLEEQEALRQNMLADVTHELRHPVHILQGNLRAILDGVYPLEMGEIARLLEQTDQLTTLVEDLHQLALAEAKQLPLNKVETDLVDLISTAIQASQSMFSRKGISVGLEGQSAVILRVVDEVRIRQAFQNILANAYHHTPEGGEIAIQLSEDDEGVRISVRDSGAGISSEHLPYIFDRFYQVDTSRNRENGGTGLGLAIAQAIVQSHGGEITAGSPGIGEGSTFTIRLP